MVGPETDTRLTPAWVLDLARAWGGGQITVDPCTPPGNPTGAEFYYTGPERDGDGSALEWWPFSLGNLHTPSATHGYAWCNPPYSRGQVQKWAEHALKQDLPVLFLTQADVSTGWFEYLIDHADAVCFFNRRIGFMRPDGSAMRGAKFGSAQWLLNASTPDDVQRFDRVYSDQGWVPSTGYGGLRA